MKNKKISIVTVCYNAIEILETTIKSVINQSYSNIEFIVIDGASTDGTLDIIEKYKEKINYFISEKDEGIYDAMNKGIGVATGDFIFFLNAGDTLYSNEVLSEICSLLKKGEVNYGDVIRKDDGYEKIYGGKFNQNRLLHENICHQAIFYPTKLLKLLRYDLRYKILGDWELNMRLWRKVPFNYINCTIAYYLEGGISSKKQDKEFNAHHRRLIYRYLGFNALLRSILDSLFFKINGKN